MASLWSLGRRGCWCALSEVDGWSKQHCKRSEATQRRPREIGNVFDGVFSTLLAGLVANGDNRVGALQPGKVAHPACPSLVKGGEAGA